MLKVSFRKIKIADKKYFTAIYTSEKDIHYTVLVNKEVIGHIALSKIKKDFYNIQIIVGEKQYWNRGYGTKAIKAIIQKTKKLGIKKYPKNKFLQEVLKMSLKPLFKEVF